MLLINNDTNLYGGKKHQADIIFSLAVLIVKTINSIQIKLRQCRIFGEII